MKIRDFLREHKLIMDGAMGTYYSSIRNNINSISELANCIEPDIILQIHNEYIASGANLIRTNSFACNRQVLKITKEEQIKLLEASYEIASNAANSSREPVFIACDIGPIPRKATIEDEEILEEYRCMVDTFLNMKPQIMLFETFSDFYFLKQIIPYVKEKAPDIFILTNFCMNKNGYSSSGISALSILNEIANNPYIDGGGFNCGIGSGHMYQIVKKLNLPKDKYIVVAPNAGYPEQFSNRMIFMDNVIYFGENMRKIADLGVDIIGGCCGTTPGYIPYIKEQVQLNPSNRGARIQESTILEKKNIQVENEFYSLFQPNKKVVAVELDPPFDANDDKIIECAHKLKQTGTDIITIADSPMGRSRVDSVLMAIKIHQETKLEVMPHVCCRDKNMIAIRSGILGAYIHGIRNILFVTGDPIPNEHRQSTTGVFDYNSIQLMNFAKDLNKEHFSTEPIYYGGALNYSRGNIDKVIERMKRKVEAGASYFLTQPIFTEEDVERIAYMKEKVNTKILCGIMPFVSYRNANFVKNEITGIYVPDEIVNRYYPEMSKEEAEDAAAKLANEIIEKLSPFADGYYFMLPFNRVSLMDKIIIK